MNEDGKALAGLSERASQGEWLLDAHVYHDEDGGPSEYRTEGVMVLGKDGEPDSIVQCSMRNADFIVALINAYRSGSLIHAESRPVEQGEPPAVWIRRAIMANLKGDADGVDDAVAVIVSNLEDPAAPRTGSGVSVEEIDKLYDEVSDAMYAADILYAHPSQRSLKRLRDHAVFPQAPRDGGETTRQDTGGA